MREPYAQEEKQFEEKVVQIDRITRVVAGGRRLRFRATVVVGDKAGQVGVGVAKGLEVVTSIQKAIQKAKKNMIKVNLKGTTIPHEVMMKYGGAKVFIKPASKGTGVIAGGAVRAVVEAAGIHDILSKMIGSSNKINNVYATFEALKSLELIEKPKEQKIKSKGQETKEKKSVKTEKPDITEDQAEKIEIEAKAEEKQEEKNPQKDSKKKVEVKE
ncbi:TPA: 30S ribosomal protein S5 [candidate division CPR2 bacterium]|uniref:Small ribosomal subunit protein uS5 n=1 Tax=candidate division CPR2 bacterium GW2011_GWC1_41_48 TaxID=1618344 RepID=A0A0G0Z746_UNCC2|nr:MAG: 30S ribosomal protein S5 [candidate division CPR2 bacterium GW2011_GWC2_39_35]KKR27167.1 MAG: 30S ribosomal protein S5 [candidate division CPR2 bacterium GW2011_GWD2_39_7]KKR29177.1 MAG: 30S ribosomal protein S5 [candidate division CPR2 bacterium GW2011_GWD1_39_7]KKS08853.1 MAG: ribosomal protein S5 [candidate division CPR2 bacterium GW2011_GWC1_41_48]OGB62157.1 MAG: 30S ribosomal protein S5 [candidate division CPR2 bacterium GWD1_39_7]OGB70316.1 MAG: 30S ribosomal protein S5 [candidat